MNKPSSNNKKKLIAGGVVVLIILFAAVGYNLGYRITNKLTLVKMGYLNMTIPSPLTSIFIDQSEKIVTNNDNQIIRLKFSPKTHSVIVSKDGYFPWTKDFIVPSGGEITLLPIFVSQNASGQIITNQDPEYQQIRNLIIRDKLPTKNLPLLYDQNIKLWVEENTIIVENENGPKKIIKPETKIRNVSFYKDRDDVVMFSTADSVYVIETDIENVQNFIPVYKGENPLFVKNNPNFIYILDGNNLMQVVI